jgi:hypothetical protein
MKATIKFRPIDERTLALLLHVNEEESSDAVATFSRLMSAAMIAGALIGLTKEQIVDLAETLSEYAALAVAERRDIFG